jgi:hypothetical protein
MESLKNNKYVAGVGVKATLNMMAFAFNKFEKYRKYLYSKDG